MVLATFSVVETPSTGNEPSTLMLDRKQLLRSFSNRFEVVSYPLLVLVCGLLSTKDYIALCPILWSDSLADSEPKILAPVRSRRYYVPAATDLPLDVFPGHAMRREMRKRVRQMHYRRYVKVCSRWSCHDTTIELYLQRFPRIEAFGNR